jgi:hypothetical protein
VVTVLLFRRGIVGEILALAARLSGKRAGEPEAVIAPANPRPAE